ncbi:dihydroflavonol 4-reductase [Fusarium tjaetaba]|uniref:Dihydroflavonol 4-reductase n=1 Tax=Fusarium tjaetaba TaxID=1567544 RepID=A0A8H5VHV2_9HYPO|nr:dihydroflavonol 4-reductase [Fusarium tjaetaba]KAF5621619.1 dihydroflavonol 4-reductase [Fusarium tjaetaba]
MSSKPIVLVTGANGYIAGPVIEAFLKAGYAVRGTVRSKSSADPLSQTLSHQVPSILRSRVSASSIYEDLNLTISGIHAIVHLAAGVSLSFTDPEPVLEVAIQGTLGVLESAITESSVKSVVLMSSIASIINGSKEAPARFTEADWNDEALEAVKKLGKESPSLLIYAASKVASERAFWKFRDERSPSFTMTALNPVFVMGPQPGLESTSKIGGTTAFIWQILSGQEIPKPLTPNPGYVDVRDIARVAVFSVDHPDKANGDRFLLASGLVPPQAAADVLRKVYPERQDIIKAGTPGQGYFPGYEFPEDRVLDASKAVKLTGQDFYPVEQTIIDTAKSFEKFL